MNHLVWCMIACTLPTPTALKPKLIKARDVDQVHLITTQLRKRERKKRPLSTESDAKRCFAFKAARFLHLSFYTLCGRTDWALSIYTRCIEWKTEEREREREIFLSFRAQCTHAHSLLSLSPLTFHWRLQLSRWVSPGQSTHFSLSVRCLWRNLFPALKKEARSACSSSLIRCQRV